MKGQRAGDRRHSPSRLPDLRALAPSLRALARRGRPLPLLYIEFSAPAGSAGSIASLRFKQATAASVKAAIGTVLRKGDLAAAGAGGRWFVVLLAARTSRRPQSADADLGVAAERLRATVQRELARFSSRHDGVQPHVVASVRCGWNVLEPAKDPLEALRHAVRGAALLARVEERRATVLAAITHELRTPLTAIIGFAERLKDGELQAERRERSLAIIIDESRRLHRLAEGLIDIGAWTAGGLRLDLEDTRLADVVAQATQAVAERATSRSVALSVAGDAAIVADRDRCLQIFINLLDNAVRYSPPGGTVNVGIAGRGKAALVTIQDAGHGFAPKLRHELGTPFTRGADGKVGLGLAIARLLVEAHGGTLAIAKRRGGGMVSVTFPRLPSRR